MSIKQTIIHILHTYELLFVRYLTHLAGLSSPPCRIFKDLIWKPDTLYIGI